MTDLSTGVSDWVALEMVRLERILPFVSRAFPSSTIYGSDGQTEAAPFVKLLGDEAEMARIAQELWKIDTAYNVKAQSHIEALKALSGIRNKAENELLRTIKYRRDLK